MTPVDDRERTVRDEGSVLVVSDDRSRPAATERLRRGGFAVRTAETCAGARSLLDGGDFDCVVADAELADGDHRDLRRAIEGRDRATPARNPSPGATARRCPRR